jgi:hypothetical protein
MLKRFLMIGAVAAALIAAGTVFTCGTAHADTVSDNRDYLQALNSDGIVTAGREQMWIVIGHSLCPAIERWDDPHQIAATVPLNISPDKAYRVVMDAGETLCWAGLPAVGR